jgi:hypothetical protein
MKQLLWSAAFVVLCALGVAFSQQPAQAASCSMIQSSLADLIANYDPPLSTTATAMTVSSGTLTFTCSGLGTGNAAHVYVLLNGSTSTSFSTPFLSGPNSFQLTYEPCLPNTGTCNGTTNLWQNTTSTAFKITNGLNGTNTIPSFSIFIGRQDAYVGDTTKYAGSLYFSFVCGEGGSQAPC